MLTELPTSRLRGRSRLRASLRRSLAPAMMAAGLLGGFAIPPAAGQTPAPATIVLEAETDQQFYREGAESEIFVQARFRAETPAPVEGAASGDGVAAAPAMRNIAFVLDRSGSMDGERMQALQAAVGGVLDRLTDRDVVSVVVFGSEVEALIEAQRCDQARARFTQLGPIAPAGGAALYDGLSQGAAQVRRFAGPLVFDQVILVTDGPATKGPREREDFVKLVESLAREGTVVSTIGLGEEFDEDLLAALARVGGGRFHFADVPARLGDFIAAEVAPMQAIVAADLVVTLEYRAIGDGIRAHGTRIATLGRSSVTWRFPQLAAGEELGVLASCQLDSFRASGIQRDLVRARLSWVDPRTGETHERVQAVTARFSPESRDLVDSHNIRVYRAAVAAMISEGLQDAIEQIDKGDARRAARELRRVRDRARDVNYTADDPEIDAMVARLDAYLVAVQARGLNAFDRKILRSGLHNQFDNPGPEAEEPR